MDEQWRDCVGFEGFYQVSNIGRIKSLDREVYNKGSGGYYMIKGQILKPRNDAYGYNVTDFWVKGEKTTVKIHRLVLDAFVGPQPNLLCDHINGKRNDNRLENLRWVTHEQNLRNKHKCNGASGLFGVRKDHRKNHWQAYCREDGKFKSLGYFKTKEEAAEAREKWDKQYADTTRQTKRKWGGEMAGLPRLGQSRGRLQG